jgi:8-oxo-dGTP pyrophosphatase MutT (NUDIX family)
MSNKWNIFLTEKELKTVGIVVCIDNKQRFLIIRRSDIDSRAGQWTIPGGHIDEEDCTIEDGAVRELYEETNLKCEVCDLTYLGQPKPEKFYFLTQKWSGDVNVDKPNPKTDKIEHDDWKWATIDEIKEIENTEFPIYLLREALKLAGFDENE